VVAVMTVVVVVGLGFVAWLIGFGFCIVVVVFVVVVVVVVVVAANLLLFAAMADFFPMRLLNSSTSNPFTDSHIALHFTIPSMTPCSFTPSTPPPLPGAVSTAKYMLKTPK
jgi:hypothetical protein